MLNTTDKIIKHKTGLLNLAEELGNVSKACQVMGMSRDTFYRYKSAVRGTEYCGRVDKHDFQLFLAINDIDHTKTKMKSLQTNGICERFHKTILQEFYQVAFRKKLYDSIEALQTDLDDWLQHYNHERTHQGKMCCGRTPIETMIGGKEIWQEKFVS